jgi:hypothetical protein
LPVPTFLSHGLFVFIDLKREVVVRFVDDDGGIFVQATSENKLLCDLNCEINA